MCEILEKLTSRKLWLAIAGLATGIALAFGADTSDIGEVAGAVTALLSIVTYIRVEGKIDAEGVKTAIVEIQEAANAIGFKYEGEEEE